MALLVLGWQVWRGLNTPSPQLRFLMVSLNGQPQKLVPGEELQLKPKDLLKLIKVSTNVPFNIGIRLFCRGCDINSLWYEELSVKELLGHDLLFETPELVIQVKYFNRPVAQVTWKIKPSVEDWMERASRVIDPNKRIKLLERAKEEFPGDHALLQRLAQEYVSQKKWTKAVKILEELAGERPEKETLITLLQIYKEMGDKKRTISTLKRLLNLTPADLQLRWELAEALEKSGRISEAIRQYEVILSKTAPGERLALYQHLGYLHTKKKQYKKALAYYLKALKLNPNDPDLHETLAFVYEKRGNKEKADHHLEKAVALRAGNLEGRLKLAARLIERKRYKEARAHLKAVLAKKPSMAALLLMVEVAEKLGDKRELKKTYEKILKLKPRNWVVVFNLGALEYEAGNLKRAKLYLERYIKAKPKDKDAHLLLFDIYKGLGEKEKAYSQAAKCLSFAPRELALYTYIFERAKETKDYEKILPFLKKGVKANPKKIVLREYLLFAYLEMGKEVEAIGVMKDILRLSPKRPKLWLSLAKLQEKRGLYKEAMASYRRVLDFWPDHEEAGEGYLRMRLKVVEGG